MTNKPHIKNTTYRLGLMMVASLFFSGITHAESFLCDATQPSTSQLPQLSQNCPIGQGLWGKALPNKSIENPTFWIQCGMLAKVLPLATAKPLYKQISTDVWMKPDNGGYRCLIGPYDDFASAKIDLAQVKRLEAYRESFIRVVDPSAPKAKVSAKPKPAKLAASKSPVKPKVKPQPKTVPSQPQIARSLPKIESGANVDISIRVQTQVDGRTYVVPYLLDNNQQFYMEHGKAWNRLNYNGAEEVCRELKMRLVTESEWKKLLASNVMEKDSWPMHLPYWGYQMKGLFTNGRVTQLKGSSLLNVLCVK